MLAGTLGLLLVGIILLLTAGYGDGNVMMVDTAQLARPAAAGVRRRRRLYVACMFLALLGLLGMVAVIAAFLVLHVGVEWVPGVFNAAAGYAGLAAVLLLVQRLRLVW